VERGVRGLFPDPIAAARSRRIAEHGRAPGHALAKGLRKLREVEGIDAELLRPAYVNETFNQTTESPLILYRRAFTSRSQLRAASVVSKWKRCIREANARLHGRKIFG
jgi:hypothetical protein